MDPWAVTFTPLSLHASVSPLWSKPKGRVQSMSLRHETPRDGHHVPSQAGHHVPEPSWHSGTEPGLSGSPWDKASLATGLSQNCHHSLTLAQCPGTSRVCVSLHTCPYMCMPASVSPSLQASSPSHPVPEPRHLSPGFPLRGHAAVGVPWPRGLSQFPRPGTCSFLSGAGIPQPRVSPHPQEQQHSVPQGVCASVSHGAQGHVWGHSSEWFFGQRAGGV